MMLRVFATLTGDRYELLRKHGPASRKKVIALGMGMLIPVAIWFGVGYAMGTKVLDKSPWFSMAMGFAAATLIFFVDRSIVLMTSPDKKTANKRMVLAILMSILGGAAVELTIFDADIQRTLVTMHREQQEELAHRVDGQYTSQLALAHKEVQHAEERFAQALAIWQAEMNGDRSGSGKSGRGAIADAKEQVVNARRQDREAAQARLEALERDQESDKEALLSKHMKAAEHPGILEHVQALHRFVLSDLVAFLTYVFFMFVMVRLELMPLQIKRNWATTSYDIGIEVQDQIRREELEAMKEVGQRLNQAHAKTTLNDLAAKDALRRVDLARKQMRA